MMTLSYNVSTSATQHTPSLASELYKASVLLEQDLQMGPKGLFLTFTLVNTALWAMRFDCIPWLLSRKAHTIHTVTCLDTGQLSQLPRYQPVMNSHRKFKIIFKCRFNLIPVLCVIASLSPSHYEGKAMGQGSKRSGGKAAGRGWRWGSGWGGAPMSRAWEHSTALPRSANFKRRLMLKITAWHSLKALQRRETSKSESFCSKKPQIGSLKWLVKPQIQTKTLSFFVVGLYISGRYLGSWLSWLVSRHATVP